jgi:hypothetical protein
MMRKLSRQYTRWTPDRKKWLEDMWRRGVETKDIGRVLNINPYAARMAASKFGFARPNARKTGPAIGDFAVKVVEPDWPDGMRFEDHPDADSDKCGSRLLHRPGTQVSTGTVW